MSLDVVKSVMLNLENGSNWSLQLLNIKNSKRTGTGYSCRKIILSPNTRLTQLLRDITKIYTESGKKSLNLVKEVREYDGTADAFTIYKLPTDNGLIATDYDTFLKAVADPNTEDDPFEYTSAYLLKGTLDIGGNETPVKLVSMQNPVTMLKHKFRYNKGTFKEFTDKIISLRPIIDILIIGDTVYFMTLSGENLFNMVRSYKAVCHQKVAEIEATGIISDAESFTATAESGHNPRRFVSFNEKRLKALKKKSVRLAMAKQFSIPLDPSGEKFDTTIEGAPDKIVKLLCNKGMTDPFEKNAVEVDGARQWH